MIISTTKKRVSFSCPKDCSTQRLCSEVKTFSLRTDTHTQKDIPSDYWGHPFRVSGFFASTYHQGSVQYRPPAVPIPCWKTHCNSLVLVGSKRPWRLSNKNPLATARCTTGLLKMVLSVCDLSFWSVFFILNWRKTKYNSFGHFVRNCKVPKCLWFAPGGRSVLVSNSLTLSLLTIKKHLWNHNMHKCLIQTLSLFSSANSCFSLSCSGVSFGKSNGSRAWK